MTQATYISSDPQIDVKCVSYSLLEKHQEPASEISHPAYKANTVILPHPKDGSLLCFRNQEAPKTSEDTYDHALPYSLCGCMSNAAVSTKGIKLWLNLKSRQLG